MEERLRVPLAGDSLRRSWLRLNASSPASFPFPVLLGHHTVSRSMPSSALSPRLPRPAIAPDAEALVRGCTDLPACALNIKTHGTHSFSTALRRSGIRDASRGNPPTRSSVLRLVRHFPVVREGRKRVAVEGEGSRIGQGRRGEAEEGSRRHRPNLLARIPMLEKGLLSYTIGIRQGKL